MCLTCDHVSLANSMQLLFRCSNRLTSTEFPASFCPRAPEQLPAARPPWPTWAQWENEIWHDLTYTIHVIHVNVGCPFTNLAFHAFLDHTDVMINLIICFCIHVYLYLSKKSKNLIVSICFLFAYTCVYMCIHTYIYICRYIHVYLFILYIYIYVFYAWGTWGLRKYPEGLHWPLSLCNPLHA